MPTVKLPPDVQSELLDQRAQQLGEEAHRRALKSGAPVAICEDGVLFHLNADGSRTAIKNVGTSVRAKKSDEYRIK